MKMKATISVFAYSRCPFNPYPVGRRETAPWIGINALLSP